jgi:hypothetical protein
VVEGARLESVCAGNCTVSSNLILSAKLVTLKPRQAEASRGLALPLCGIVVCCEAHFAACRAVSGLEAGLGLCLERRS